MKPNIKPIVSFAIIFALAIGLLFMFYVLTGSGSGVTGVTDQPAVSVPTPKLDNAPLAGPKPAIETVEEKLRKEQNEQSASAIARPEPKVIKPIVAPPSVGDKPVHDNKPETQQASGHTTLPVASTSLAVRADTVRKQPRKNIPATAKQQQKLPARLEEETSYTFISLNAPQDTTSKTKQSPTDQKKLQIQAVVLGDQNITPGQYVKLRITEAFSFARINFAKNTILKAKCSVTEGRLLISASSIVYQGSPIPFVADGYDPADMILGLGVPDLDVSQQQAQSVENLTSTTANALSGGLATGPLAAGQVITEGFNLIRIKNNKIYMKDGQKIILITR